MNNNHHTTYRFAHQRVLDALHALTIGQVQALTVAADETSRSDQLEAMNLTALLEAFLDGPQRHVVDAQRGDRDDIREAAVCVPHWINDHALAALDDETFDTLDDELDRFCHVVDCLAFALTEFARHGMHGRTARYLVLIQPWASVMGDPLEP